MSPAVKCGALMDKSFALVPDAPTRLTSARLVDAKGNDPAYCEVQGYVSPQVGILIWLPAEKWNGRFLEVGCGGFCGVFDFIRNCVKPLRKGYACITTDMGHRATEAAGGRSCVSISRSRPWLCPAR